jgi:hypothetical protein
MSGKVFDKRCAELAVICLDGYDYDLSDVDDLVITIQLAIEEWLAAHPVAE